MIEVIQGDITTLEVDAIVNAANSTLLGVVVALGNEKQNNRFKVQD